MIGNIRANQMTDDVRVTYVTGIKVSGRLGTFHIQAKRIIISIFYFNLLKKKL